MRNPWLQALNKTFFFSETSPVHRNASLRFCYYSAATGCRKPDTHGAIRVSVHTAKVGNIYTSIGDLGNNLIIKSITPKTGVNFVGSFPLASPALKNSLQVTISLCYKVRSCSSIISSSHQLSSSQPVCNVPTRPSGVVFLVELSFRSLVQDLTLQRIQ